MAIFLAQPPSARIQACAGDSVGKHLSLKKTFFQKGRERHAKKKTSQLVGKPMHQGGEWKSVREQGAFGLSATEPQALPQRFSCHMVDEGILM